MLKSIGGEKRGETITETIIALSVLAIGITLSSTLMASSLRNINVSKNRFIAVNIAREGIEAMRNIRDTNWLKFSSRRRTCWNHSPQELPDDCTDIATPGVSDNAIEPGNYIIYKDEGHRWRLAPANTGSEPSITDYTPLFTVDIDGDGESDMYNHSPDLISDALGETPQTTVFKREITIEYLDDDGNTEDNTANNRMRVTSAVSWFRSGIERTVELKTHLTDYLGRDNLQN